MKRKFKHSHKGRIHGFATNYFLSSRSVFSVKVIETGLLTANQLETLRRGFKRRTRKCSSAQRRPDFFISEVARAYSPRTKKKSARMGSSKGPFHRLVSPAKSGQVIFSASYQQKLKIGFFFLKSVLKKMPVRTNLLFNYNSSNGL